MQFEDSNYSFSKSTLRFDDPLIEAAYISHHNVRALPGLRLTIVLFIAFVLLPTLIEYYGFFEEGWVGYEYYLGILPFRIAGIVLLCCGLALTYYSAAIRNGQAVVFLFGVLLFIIVMASNQWYGPWILLTTPVFNFGLTLILIACGLLIRYAAPLALVASAFWIVILNSWVENSFSPAFLSLSTMFILIVVSHAKERAERLAWSSQAQLANEKKVSEKLLLNVLPSSIADRMRSGESLIADKHENVAVVFADIVNFTSLSEMTPPDKLVQILDDIFTRFDRIADDLNLEKIKTIGDAYMMAAGLPVERPVNPSLAAEAALRMREAVHEVNRSREIEIDIRAGIHVGEVVAGVIGQSKFVYDLWGDVVNVASRMESTAPNGEIQVSEEMHKVVHDQFQFAPRGQIAVKGKGQMSTWVLTGRK